MIFLFFYSPPGFLLFPEAFFIPNLLFAKILFMDKGIRIVKAGKFIYLLDQALQGDLCMEGKPDFLGKKVVFVYPPDIVKDALMKFLSDREYEVYTLMDHTKIPQIFKAYPDTIFFLNIDTVLPEWEWQGFIRHKNKSCPGIQFGVHSFRVSDREQLEYYLFDLEIKCGFIQLKQGIKSASDMILKVMLANEVKGRRKYLRYQCMEEDNAFLNFKYKDRLIKGRITDVSSVGVSCKLESPPNLSKNELISNIQMRLKGFIVHLDVILMGSRNIEGEQTTYVFLYRGEQLSKEKSRIRTFIYAALQKQFNREFLLS